MQHSSGRIHQSLLHNIFRDPDKFCSRTHLHSNQLVHCALVQSGLVQVGVIAPRAHRVCTVATISGQTPSQDAPP